MSLNPLLRRLRDLLILALALVLGFMVLDFGLRHWLRSEGSFPVPDLKGLSREEAYKVASRKGLLLEEGPSEFDPWLPEGFVLRQRPRAPEKVKEGRRVRIALSAGPPQTAVPDLRDESERQARLRLEDMGLVAGSWTRVVGDLEAGRVLATRPADGTRLPRGGRVDLLISDGPGEAGYLLPNLVGRTLPEALSLLEKSGLGHPRIRYGQAAGGPAGRILQQNLPAGSRLTKGEDLELVVASGF